MYGTAANRTNFGNPPFNAIARLLSGFTPKFANALADWRWINSWSLVVKD